MSCTAAILAGGRARRLGGRDKSTLPIAGSRVIDRQIDVLRAVADHLLIVSNGPDQYADLDLPIVADLIPGAGALGGLYTALVSSPTPQTLVVACDMPFLSVAFLKHLVMIGRDVDAAVPRTQEGYEPLCASYSRDCVGPIRRRIEAGALKVTSFLGDVRMREIGPDELTGFDPEGTLFLNVNTPDDYARALNLLDSGP